MASPQGRGAQVRLDGTAQAAARGAIGGRLIDAIVQKAELEAAGTAANGNTADGSTSTGDAALDEVLAPGGGDGGLVAYAENYGADASGEQDSTAAIQR